MPAPLLHHRTDGPHPSLMANEQQCLVRQGEHALLHAVPQGLGCRRSRLVRAGVNGQQVTTKQSVAPGEAEAPARAAWCGQHVYQFVAKEEYIAVTHPMHFCAALTLHDRLSLIHISE